MNISDSNQAKTMRRATPGRQKAQATWNGRRWWAVAYILVASVLFAALAFTVDHRMLPVDLAITRALQSLRSPVLDTIMKMIGLPGYFPQTIVLNAIFVLVVYLCRMKWAAISLTIVGSFTGISGTILRYSIDRPRPGPQLVWVAQEIEKGHYSFPSGHTLGFLAILGFLMFLGYTQIKPSWHRNLVLALYALYIGAVGVSRIYVGEHWPTDILGGYLYGSICLALLILFYQWGRERFEQWATRRGRARKQSPV